MSRILFVSHCRNAVVAMAVLSIILVAGLYCLTSISGSNAQTTAYYPMDVDSTGSGTYVDSQGIEYTVTDDYAMITGYTAKGVTEIVFPSAIHYNDTYYVVKGVADDSSYWSTGKYFEGDVDITRLTVYVDCSDYVLSSDLFKNNGNLTALTISYNAGDSSVNCSIGSSAFDGCTGLVEINLPTRIATMGVTVFANCTGLESLTFDTSVGTFKAAESQSGLIFAGCTNLKYLYIGKNVDNLPENMFSSRSDTGHKACANIKIVYNAGTKITQSEVESSVSSSGSTQVVIFNLCGGDLQTSAVINSSSQGTINVTMPSATITNEAGVHVEIPSWTDKNGSKFSSLASGEVSFKGGAKYHTYYGNCTISYYEGNTLLDTQDVVCEYATALKDYSSGTCWSTSKDSGGTIYYFGQTVVISQDLKLYLKSSSIPTSTVTVTFYSNDGSSASETQTMSAGVSTALIATSFTRSLYKIIGWSESSSAKFPSYAPEMNVCLSKNLILYAVWAEDNAVTIVPGNDMIDYDGASHSVCDVSKVIVFGLAEGEYVVVTDFYVVDSQGHPVSGGTVKEVSEVGVYYYAIEYKICSSDGTDITSQYRVQLYNGLFTINNNSGRSSVIIGPDDGQ